MGPPYPLLLNKVQYEYWKELISPKASLNDLPNYGRRDPEEGIKEVLVDETIQDEAKDLDTETSPDFEMGALPDSALEAESEIEASLVDIHVNTPPVPARKENRSRWI